MPVKTISGKKYKWFNVSRPTNSHLEFLQKNFPFHPLNLEDYQTKTQSPKLDLYRHYTLIVLDLPYFGPGEEKILVGEVDFFLGPDYLVTLNEENLPPLEEVFKRCQENEKYRQRNFGDNPAFLFYRLVDLLIDACFPVLDKISASIEKIDQEILGLGGKNTLAQISLQRRNIVFFQTMVKPTLPIFERLEKGAVPRLNEKMVNYWGNLLDHLQKIWERLEDQRELIEGLAATYESLLSFRTNEIIKILTIFSAFMLPLTLLASIYGMNITGLPLAQHPLSLALISLLMLFIAGGMFSFFKLKRWL